LIGSPRGIALMVERRSLPESNFSLSPKEGDPMSSQEQTSPQEDKLEELARLQLLVDLLTQEEVEEDELKESVEFLRSRIEEIKKDAGSISLPKERKRITADELIEFELKGGNSSSEVRSFFFDNRDWAGEVLWKVDLAIYLSEELGLVQNLSDEEREAVEKFINDENSSSSSYWDSEENDEARALFRASAKLFQLASLKQQTESEEGERKYRRCP
jgi:hypothetical protein